MKLGIMQPYFFPYLDYFDLTNYADKWVVFDNVQYIRHGWINRNRVLHPTEGWQYIIVPVKVSRNTLIKDVRIAADIKWDKRILGQLQHYKKKAPYYDETIHLVDDCLKKEEPSISRLNVLILKKVCEYLEIRFDYSFFSEMNLDLGPIDGPGDWALRISEAMGAREYVNPAGGAALFDEGKFRESKIKLTIRNLPSFEYSCRGYEFVQNLSIIDVMMWNRPEEIKQYLDDHNAVEE